ncbi:MAG TPA: sigma-54 dependent transcriptional regulator [Candidatus Acidoferrales bacterium]|nr:sigma-54 dependent transcriptional regulator [Candidatus Acidoferrales bacterium]
MSEHPPRILIADDDSSIRDVCSVIAQSAGYIVLQAESGQKALQLLEKDPTDVLLLDLRMPGMNGLSVLESVSTKFPDLVVVIMTGYGSVQSAVEAIKKGAYDYITKPFHLDEFRLLLRRISERIALSHENRMLREQLDKIGGFSLMVGRTAEMQKLFRVVARAAQGNNSVLIHGASGAGKETLARSIHASGPRHNYPFLRLDCAIPDQHAVECELFGCEKGAHNTTVAQEGLLAAAQEGTVFLDEVGQLSLDLQAKLLRALQERAFRPVGSSKSVPTLARVLASSSTNLEQSVAEGRFRQDLYFRLGVVSMRLPALKDRRDDIPALTRHFLEEVYQERGVRYTIADDALARLVQYDWPGNVSELKSCIEHACTFTSGTRIRVYELPPAIAQWKLPDTNATAERVPTLAEVERETILRTIDRMNGDKLKAARMLGIGRTTLYRKLMEYDQHIPRDKEEAGD